MNPSVKCNLKNLVVLIDTKLPEKSRYYLYKPFMNIIGSQERQNFESMHELFVICTCVTNLHLCYNFAIVLHGNALVFSQSEARNYK